LGGEEAGDRKNPTIMQYFATGKSAEVETSKKGQGPGLKGRGI